MPLDETGRDGAQSSGGKSSGVLTRNEIASQPAVWSVAAEMAAEQGAALAAPGESILVLGCGTSAFVAASLAALRERAGFGLTDWAYASELPVGRTYDRVVALTRSGTTTEVTEALEHVVADHRVVVTAVADSPASDLADEIVLLDFADESSVVQTRFPTTTLALVRAALGEDMAPIIEQAERALSSPLDVSGDGLTHFVYLGRGWTLGLAHEAALKIREAAQANAESYPALDYRHGPIALAGSESLVWVFGESPAGLVDDIASTGARVLVGDQDPLVQLVQAQRLAVAVADSRGLDPDRPRNLTRSVILGVVGKGIDGIETSSGTSSGTSRAIPAQPTPTTEGARR